MGHLIECQVAVVPWGTRARYRAAKIGLVRQGTQVYIAIFSQIKQQKFLIKTGSIQVHPAAIRVMDVQSDIFVKRLSDEYRFADMLRGMKVLLRKDELIRSGKGDKLNKFVADIPQISSLKRSDVQVSARSLQIARVNMNHEPDCMASSNSGQSTSVMVGLSDRMTEHYHMLHKHEMERLENTQLKCIKSVGLRELPNQIWLAQSLNELQLIDCNLLIVPKQLEKLASTLRSLDLSRNDIKELPRTFCCKMECLFYLNVSHNAIETLPLEIKFLRSLKEFNISNNCLRILPTTLSDLRRLRVLRVDHNKLSQLPAFRREDIRLGLLDISHNPLDGALRHFSTFELHASYDDQYDPFTLSYMSSPLLTLSTNSKGKVPSLFETSILNVVRSDCLFKLASEEPLPKTIVSTIQRDIFKCFKCNKMNILPAYNSLDTLDYVDQIENLRSSCNYSSSMTFMKLLCRTCFDRMTS